MTHVTSEDLRIAALTQSYALASGEDRCAVRHKVAVPAKLRLSGCSSFAVNVTDLSLAGFACDAMVQSPPGTRCWLALPGLAPLEAEVVHRSNLGLGCAFQNLLNAAVLERFVTDYRAS